MHLNQQMKNINVVEVRAYSEITNGNYTPKYSILPLNETKMQEIIQLLNIVNLLINHRFTHDGSFVTHFPNTKQT